MGMDLAKGISVGCRSVELFDEQAGVGFPMLVLYPGCSPERVEKPGPYDLAAARDGMVTAGRRGPLFFLSPFPEAMTSPQFAPSQDPAGFDRVRFHEEMNEVVLQFLRGKGGPSPLDNGPVEPD